MRRPCQRDLMGNWEACHLVSLDRITLYGGRSYEMLSHAFRNLTLDWLIRAPIRRPVAPKSYAVVSKIGFMEAWSWIYLPCSFPIRRAPCWGPLDSPYQTITRTWKALGFHSREYPKQKARIFHRWSNGFPISDRVSCSPLELLPGNRYLF